MKKRSEIKNINAILSVAGLAILLLLSPCKVRNHIQVELGVPQTKVSNKSQSTISNLNCLVTEVSEAVQTSTKPIPQEPNFLIPDAFPLEFTRDILNQSFHFTTSRSHSVSVLPLFILYQNFRVYS